MLDIEQPSRHQRARLAHYVKSRDGLDANLILNRDAIDENQWS